MIDVHLLTSDDYQSITQKIEELEEKIAHLMKGKQQVKRSEYLTVIEFLAAIKVSRGTFENMRREANPAKFRVNSLKRNNKVYVPESEVERYYTFH